MALKSQAAYDEAKKLAETYELRKLNNGLTPDQAWEQQVSTKIRLERNILLDQTDYTQTPDSPPNTAAWATYRQALRDIPQQAGFPFEVVWPALPEQRVVDFAAAVMVYASDAGVSREMR